MKVFNLYKKLFKSYSIIVVIYVVLFVGLSVILSTSSTSNSAFVETKVNVSMKNLDNDSTLSKGLVDYLESFVNYKEVEDEDIKDALYFRQITAAITIPKDFEVDFLDGKEVEINQARIDENINTIAIERAINKYLNYVRVYSNQTDESLDEIIKKVNIVLEKEVDANTLIKESNELMSSGVFYRMFAYIVMAVILTVVGLITIAFRKFEVRRRLIVSPYPTKNANLDMLFGNMLFTIALVTILCVVSIPLYPHVMFEKNGMLLVINAFIFGFAALSMSYFISLLIKKEQVLSGVNNVYSLGTSFLTGAFVSQELLSKGILAFAHIFPSYYYINNVEIITSTTNLHNVDYKTIIINIVVQILFTCLFVVLSVLLSKRQMQAEE